MKLTSEEVAAANAYSDTAYHSVNDALRFGEHMDSKTRKTIKHLDSAIAKSRLTRKLVVYRGVDEDYARVVKNRKLRPGDSLIDAGFLSTSTRKDVARRFLGWEGGGLLLKIHVPRGSNALDMHPYSKNSDEHEMLLPRDAELQVMGYDANADTLELKVV